MDDVALDELRARLGDEDLVLLDVRTPSEFEGVTGAGCDPRQGHIPGARSVPLEEMLACRSTEELRELVAAEADAEVIVYCHVGSRSAFAAQVLAGAGYRARNYAGSWHEWSRVEEG